MYGYWKNKWKMYTDSRLMSRNKCKEEGIEGGREERGRGESERASKRQRKERERAREREESTERRERRRE